MSDQTFEERLGQALHERADLVADSPLTLDDVRGAARRIRRRRRAAVAGAALAALAVLVPVGLSVFDGPERAVEPAAPVVEPAPPSYVQDGVVHLLDGTEVPLAGVGEVRSYAPLGEGYVAEGTRRGASVVSLHDSTGALEATWPASSSLVVDGDGVHAAWLHPSGEAALLDGSTGTVERLPPVDGADLHPRGIVGDCPEDCGVVVSESGAPGWGPTYLTSTDGTVTPYLTEIPLVLAVAPDDSLVAGVDRAAPDDIHVCTGVWVTGAAGSLWEGCEDNVFEFSPGATHVATTFAEGLGPRELRLRDARTGAVLHDLGLVESVAGFAWEDEEHVLAVVQRRAAGGHTLERIGVDGTVEVVAGPAEGTLDSNALPRPPYLLPVT
ncbi:hypothetical protein [Nocardioides sp. SYSU DS0663]|uniref:hypothetical protein n=1 Tax=Nocardioides sp. SYSU DS0663 TaxID=3416445 RepID=UPI003F4BA164